MFPNTQSTYMPTFGYQSGSGGYYPYGYPMISSPTTTYSAPGGGTNQGNQLEQLQKALSTITNMPPQQAQDLQTGATQAYAGLEANQPAYMSQEQQDIGQALGIPALQGQTGNINQLFQLYLAHKGMSDMSSQFSNPTGNLNPYANPQLLASSQQGAQQLATQNAADMAKVSGMTTGNQPTATITAPTPTTSNSPFQGTPQSVVDAASNLPVAPSIVTSEMGAPLSGGVQLMNLLNQLLGVEGGIQSQKLDLAGQNYTGIMNAIGTIANTAGQATQNAQNLAINAASMPGTKQQAGSVFNDIVDQVQQAKGGNATETDIWDYINQHDSALRDQGVNVDELWKLQKQMAQKVGQGGSIAGGKTTSKPISTKTIGGEVMEWNPQTKAYDIPAGGTQAIDKSSQMLDNYLSKWKSMNEIEKVMPSSITSTIPGLFPDRAYLDTDFFTQIEPLLRKTVVGGRITQQEMTWLKNALPKAGDTDQSAAAKIQAIKEALSQGGIGQASGVVPSSKGGSESDPLNLGL